MVSVEPPPPVEEAASPITSSPRISFSSEFLDDSNFICINPVNVHVEKENEKAPRNNATVNNNGDHNFEFSASSNAPSPSAMLTADELFFEGKLLPFWQKQCADKLGKISLGGSVEDRVAEEEKVVINNKGEENSNSNRMSWFIDEDPSPRPPKCTVLWKELLRLKKQRSSAASSTLSPSSSTSSSSSSSSIHELAPIAEGKEGKQNVKRVKKGLERTRSASIRIRPVVSVPEGKGGNSGLPPLFTLRKLKLDR